MAVEAFVSGGRRIEPPDHLVGVLGDQAGVFVTLRTADGALRGCVGTIEPVNQTVALEIVQNAIKAAMDDPRFAPVVLEELADLTYGVDVLSPPEAAAGIGDLDPLVYGVIVETLDCRRRGLLLPRIEGIRTAEEQWLAVHLKAGIRPGEPVRAERFTVTRYGKD